MKPLMLWGGVDINPRYYDETPLRWTQPPNKHRDMHEFQLIGNAIAKGIPVIGICRGAQLICIENGGSLYQHSEPLVQSHSIQTKDKLFERVIAGHHQIMNPKGNYELLGWNPTPTPVWRSDEPREFIMLENSAEVVWYPDTKCLAIQPHPEWAVKGDLFVDWLNTLLKEKGIEYVFRD